MDSISEFDKKILVTGSNGFIGAKVVEVLLEYGCRNIRCFVRPSSQRDRLDAILRRLEGADKVEIVAGDLRTPADCVRAARDVSLVYHLAAGFDKSFDDAFANSAIATQNLLEAFAGHGKPRRFVNVSSFAVYSNFRMERGAPLDEMSPTEESPRERFDAYTFGKLKQEEIVRYFGRGRKIPFVILRPGTVFGPGNRDLTGRIGFRVSRFFFHVGGSNQLPLTYVDNCAEAIVLAGVHPGIEGETFNVVDDDLLTSRQFLDAYRRHVGRFLCFRVPYGTAYFLFALCELCAKYGRPFPKRFNRRRCAAEWKGNRYSNRKLRERLGWKPRVPIEKAMEAFLGQFESNGNDDPLKR
jgi:nucleoside-diphosphate-sugar epimerase